MRTTVDLDDGLMKRAKRHIAEEGISLKDFISRSVEKSLAETKRSVRMDEPPVRSLGRQIPVLRNRDIEELFTAEEERRNR